MYRLLVPILIAFLILHPSFAGTKAKADGNAVMGDIEIAETTGISGRAQAVYDRSGDGIDKVADIYRGPPHCSPDCAIILPLPGIQYLKPALAVNRPRYLDASSEALPKLFRPPIG